MPAYFMFPSLCNSQHMSKIFHCGNILKIKAFFQNFKSKISIKSIFPLEFLVEESKIKWNFPIKIKAFPFYNKLKHCTLSSHSIEKSKYLTESFLTWKYYQILSIIVHALVNIFLEWFKFPRCSWKLLELE